MPGFDTTEGQSFSLFFEKIVLENHPMESDSELRKAREKARDGSL